MNVRILEVATEHTPETLAAPLHDQPGTVVLRSAWHDMPYSRYSFVAAEPFLGLQAKGACLEWSDGVTTRQLFGNPWRVFEMWLSRFELLDAVDLPFPLGGCFGFWGYDLKYFLEPRLRRLALDDLELPDCVAWFHDSLVVFDHRLGKTWIVSTGLQPDGSRSAARAQSRLETWRRRLETPPAATPHAMTAGQPAGGEHLPVRSSMSHSEYVCAVERALQYIRAGDIYQVNLAHRLECDTPHDGWALYLRLLEASPAPFAGFVNCGAFALASSSPELFLRFSGAQVQTRPIKGTRPRSADPTRDAQLTYELQTSPKEMAELVMITDLLRNDLGRVCEYGSVHVPDLVRLERYPQVQHLVSTVEGRLRPGVSHLQALASCFPGGSITGAPKVRAMEIIEELEPVARGPYTGCMGYLGFNRESQLNILIRTAVCRPPKTWFHVGAGIVADSNPEAEYVETLVKARGFIEAMTPTPHAAQGLSLLEQEG